MTIKIKIISTLVLFFLACTGCSIDAEFEEVMEIPLSTLTYTEDHESAKIVLQYVESDSIIFSDNRNYKMVKNGDSCFIFSSVTTIIDERNGRQIGFGFGSKAREDQLESNNFFFKAPSDFEDHIHLESGSQENPLFCDVQNGETFLISVFAQNYFTEEGENSERVDLSLRLEEEIEVVNFRKENIRFGGLGYILLDMEINYFAFEIRYSPSTEDSSELNIVPVNLKVSHAIRFPEIDK